MLAGVFEDEFGRYPAQLQRLQAERQGLGIASESHGGVAPELAGDSLQGLSSPAIAWRVRPWKRCRTIASRAGSLLNHWLWVVSLNQKFNAVLASISMV